MGFYTESVITATIIFMLLIWMLLESKKDRTNILTIIFFFLIMVWSGLMAVFFRTQDRDTAIWLSRISSVGWNFSWSIIALYFIAYTHTDKDRFTKRQCFLYFVPEIIMEIACLIPGLHPLMTTIEKKDGYWIYANQIEHNPMLFLYIIINTAYLIFAWQYIKKWNVKESYRVRSELTYIHFKIIVVCYLLFMILDVGIPVIGGRIYPIGHLVMLIYVAFYIFSIKKYDIMNVNHDITADNMLQNSSDLIIVSNIDGTIVKTNLITDNVLDVDPRIMWGKSLADFIPEADCKEIQKTLNDKGSLNNYAVNVSTTEGKQNNALVSASVATDSSGDFWGIVYTLKDVTLLNDTMRQLKKSNEEYMKLADKYYLLSNTDKLTLLPNRRRLLDEIEKRIQEYQNGGRKFALLFIDLDHFKMVNDTYGHKTGDMVLQEAAGKLLAAQSICKSMACRIGGDEFVILIWDYDLEEGIERCRNKIEEEFARPIQVGGGDYTIEGSIGICRFDEIPKGQQNNAEVLLEMADQRMYIEKQRRRKAR